MARRPAVGQEVNYPPPGRRSLGSNWGDELLFFGHAEKQSVFQLFVEANLVKTCVVAIEHSGTLSKLEV
jgi:hypothetical protein